MSLTGQVYSPYCVAFPRCGEVAAGKVMWVNGADNADKGKFVVFDPATGGVTAFQLTGAGGHTLALGCYGASDGTGAWFAFSTTGGVVQLVYLEPNANYTTVPSTVSANTPAPVLTPAGTAGQVWVFATNANVAPRIYDIGTGLWLPAATVASITAVSGQPVYADGYVWAIGGNTLYQYDPTTYAPTTITSSATLGNANQAAIDTANAKVYWAIGTTVIELDTTTSTVTYHTGLATLFGSSLVLGPDGLVYGTNNSAATAYTWDPATGATTTNSTGVSGVSLVRLGFLGAGKLCFAGFS